MEEWSETDDFESSESFLHSNRRTSPLHKSQKTYPSQRRVNYKSRDEYYNNLDPKDLTDESEDNGRIHETKSNEKIIKRRVGVTNSTKCSQLSCKAITIMFLCIFLSVYALCRLRILLEWEPKQNEKIKLELAKLQQKYPNQRSDLWKYISRIFVSQPAVHTMMLLHEDYFVADCIARDIAILVNTVINKENEVIAFENTVNSDDYGVTLVKYLNIVKKTRHLFVPQVEKVTGDTAKIFHTLCDGITSEIKPSYFIFTLRDMSNSSSMKAGKANRISRAGITLRKAWSSLADNELHPLLARIVGNVFDVLPENITECN